MATTTRREYSAKYCPLVGIVFDLDEMLVHTTSLRTDDLWEEDIRVRRSSFPIFDGSGTTICKIRPGARDLISLCFNRFDFVCVWTAAEYEYAMDVIDNVFCDMYRSELKCIMTRDDCKDLPNGSDKHKPLAHMKSKIGIDCELFILDDRLINFHDNMEKGVLVKKFLGEEHDDELQHIISCIESCSTRSELIRTMHKLARTSHTN